MNLADHPEVAAVAVKSATGLWTTIGVWVFGSAGFGAIVTAIVRYGPGWQAARLADKKADMEESERLRLDRREDYRELRSEFASLKSETEVIMRHCTAVDMRMGQLEWIIGLAFDELDRLDPNNAIARKAREMFGRLYPVPPLTAELEQIRRKLDPFRSPIANDKEREKQDDRQS